MDNKELQKNLYKEVQTYNLEYKKSIKKLMEVKNINEILSPLTALIMQYIENELKAILQDYFEIKQSATELKINNHNCKNILNKVKKKFEKYLNIDSINNQFTRINECINYLEAIYGNNILINARYPVDAKELTVSRKGERVISDEYKIMFTVLNYAIEHLINFYQIEKVYQKISKLDNAKEQLKDFMKYFQKDDGYKFNIINIVLIKEIDKCNDNILEEIE